MSIRWNKAGTAVVLEAVDDRVTVLSTIPSAPGSRIEGSVPSGAAVRLKVSRCKAEGEGFRIEGKRLDATRSVRDEVAALIAAQ
ncbi:MAG: hypothetical protein IPK82_15325 [Polyangiaceae bacterium]|nr:hypothetical protein [Polyangiaceae bacterium]